MSTLKIKQIHKLFVSGQLSPVELCERCIVNAERASELNAYITHTPKLALQQAAASHDRYKQGKSLGLLDGIPIAIKDNFSTKSVRTTCASNMLKDYVPNYNAAIVEQLVDAGGVIMGKTNMDEFAMGVGSVDSAHGPVRNPWRCPSDADPPQQWRVCGGSSGGSAAALAALTCVCAVGSDTGGSTRCPASHCGLVGVKPTYGLLSRWGLVPLVNSLDTPAILTRYVEDAEIVLHTVISTQSPQTKDSTCPAGDAPASADPSSAGGGEGGVVGVRVGIPQEYCTEDTHGDVLSLWGEVADALERGGAEVVPCSLPHTQYSIVCYSVLAAAEVASNMARYDGVQYGSRDIHTNTSTEELYASTRHRGFNDVVRGRILAGNYFLLKKNCGRYYSKARAVRRLISDDFSAVLRRAAGSGGGCGCDLLLTPVTPEPAATYDHFTAEDSRSRVQAQDVFTQPANMAGLPAMSVPVGLSKEQGLPIGLQLIGPRYSEQLLLRVASFIETQQSFPLHLNPMESRETGVNS